MSHKNNKLMNKKNDKNNKREKIENIEKKRNIFLEFLRITIGIFGAVESVIMLYEYYSTKNVGMLVLGSIFLTLTFFMFYVLAPKKTKVQIDDNLDIF